VTISEGLLTLGLLVGSAGIFLAVTRRCKHDWECIGGTTNDGEGRREGYYFCRKCQRRKQENFMWW